jgi:type VI secretion system protein
MRSFLCCHSVRLTVFVAVTVLSSCIQPGLRPRLKVAVNVAPDANRNQPIAVDLVEIDDKDLSKELAKMTAADWFQKREQIEQDFPRSKSVSIRSWEWVPGEVVPDIKIPMRRPPRSIVVFAKYSTPGPHRAALAANKPVVLQLAREDMKAAPIEK